MKPVSYVATTDLNTLLRKESKHTSRSIRDESRDMLSLYSNFEYNYLGEMDNISDVRPST